jgi:hypothetical protein
MVSVAKHSKIWYIKSSLSYVNDELFGQRMIFLGERLFLAN